MVKYLVLIRVVINHRSTNVFMIVMRIISTIDTPGMLQDKKHLKYFHNIFHVGFVEQTQVTCIIVGMQSSTLWHAFQFPHYQGQCVVSISIILYFLRTSNSYLFTINSNRQTICNKGANLDKSAQYYGVLLITRLQQMSVF